jgi:hypothetical protein
VALSSIELVRATGTVSHGKTFFFYSFISNQNYSDSIS